MMPSPWGSTLTAACGSTSNTVPSGSTSGRAATILSTACVTAIRRLACVAVAVLTFTIRSEKVHRAKATGTVPFSALLFFHARRATFDAVPVVGAVMVVAVPVDGASQPAKRSAQRAAFTWSPRSRGSAAMTAARITAFGMVSRWVIFSLSLPGL